MPSSHLILCHPLLFLPPVPPSIRVFSNESTLHMRWPKYWSFSFSISPSSEHPGLISFTMNWLDLLAVQGTLKSLLQHYSSKACINSYKCNGSVGEESPCSAGDVGSVPESGRTPGEGNGNPLQYSGNSHRQRSLAGYSPWICKELDMNEHINLLLTM